MGKVGGSRAVKPIIDCLSSEYGGSRLEASQVHDNFYYELAIEPLIARLDDGVGKGFDSWTVGDHARIILKNTVLLPKNL